MKLIQTLKKQFSSNKKYFKNDFLAGITVALALIPEAIAFAFVAGVSPIISLQTAVVIGLVAASITGRPGMISSSTAAIAIILAPLIAQYGLEYLFATVILIGVIQIMMGVFKLGKYTSIIPHPVVLGFLNGLAIVIFFAQWAQFKRDGIWLPTPDLLIMLGFVGLTMLIIHYFPKITKAVPSSLVAIATLTLISVILSKNGIYSLETVQDFAGIELKGGLPSFYIPQITISWEVLQVIFPYAFIASLVGLTEATLTLRVIDEMTDTKGKTNKEYFAQGLANVVNGFFGGMGGDAMIGQSIVNIKSGGRTRLSGLVAAIALMMFIMFASPLVNAIPLASLVGLMFMVVISTFKWESLKYGKNIPREDFIVIIAVSLITIFQDLATAVIIGVLLSTVMFAWKKGKKMYVNTMTGNDGSKIYKINGVLFFGSVLNFKSLFTIKEDPKKVVLDLKYAKVMDYSALEAINSIAEKYKLAGKKLIVTRPGESCKQLLKDAERITSIVIDHSHDPTHKATADI
ncbi:MAG: SulP family inorganic anion transporter [Candidatus Gracilibacteria bacterium]|nr:SulP family inorganic anion transporter [Candidatus Gracilibacteria bacterium]